MNRAGLSLSSPRFAVAGPGSRCAHRCGAAPVSVIVPAREARATLGAALDSILAQDYAGTVEVIVADGSHGGSTAELVRRRYPSVRRIENPWRTTPAGLNVALCASRHPVVARCDAGCVLPPDYLARAVATLERTGAGNVGGRQRAVGRTAFERAVALAMGGWLGSGGAAYRVGGTGGPVDTVYLGVFRREALEAAGGFEETLERNQDYEMNWRLRELGWTVWLDPCLAVEYRPRGSIGALARQYFDYGRWKREMLRRHPRAWRARQFAAPLLVLALAGSSVLGAAAMAAGAWEGAPALLALAGAAPGAYVLALLAGTGAAGLVRRRREAVLLPAVLVTMHLAWGAGFLIGVRGDG